MDEIKPGMKTKYRGKIAYVVECINEDDKQDLKTQGKRWYIDSDGFRWSVTESELRENRWV
jgi:hypothetical protein